MAHQRQARFVITDKDDTVALESQTENGQWVASITAPHVLLTAEDADSLAEWLWAEAATARDSASQQDDIRIEPPYGAPDDDRCEAEYLAGDYKFTCHLEDAHHRPGGQDWHVTRDGITFDTVLGRREV